MVFIHDPRSEDTQQNKGDESMWRSLCCFGNEVFKDLAEENSILSDVNNNISQEPAKENSILSDVNNNISQEPAEENSILSDVNNNISQKPVEENSILIDVNNNITEGSSAHNIFLEPNASTDIMENHHSKRKDKNIRENPQSSKVPNIILNDDFSLNLKFWKVTSTGGGYVVPKASNYLEDILPYSGENYLVINRRTSMYDGLEQDITEKISINLEYTFSAWVRLYGGSLSAEDKAEVRAMLRLDYSDKKEDAKWALLAREYVSTDGWKNFVGRYTFVDMPKRVILFFEGPEEGVDVLIDSVVMSPSVV